jgi:FkbM family methyltransferase
MKLGLSTKTKMLIARLLRGLLVRPLSALGYSPSNLQCIRRGLKWNLDLNEGIDLSIFALGSFEPQTLRLIKRLVKPGDTVFDIGANIGAHTLHLAKQVGATGRVIAIEPTDWAYAKLLRNIELNTSLKEVTTTIQAALCSNGGEVPSEFHSSWSLSSSLERHPIHMGVLKSASNSISSTLDALAQSLEINRLDLIKIDVDGFEVEVFNGAREIIQRFLPVIVLELSPDSYKDQGRDFNKLLDFLEEYNYSLYDEANGELLPKDRHNLLQIIPRAGGINAIASQRPPI